jgi:plastocyanin
MRNPILQSASVVVLLLMSAPSLRADEPGATELTATPAAPVTAETGADGIQRLSITLDSYSFTPASIVVQAGKPVEFTLKNVATFAPHSFKLDAVEDGLDLYQEVEPGKTATLSFTPAKPGIYEFYCDQKLAFFPSHRKKGMVGKLEVR